MTTLVVIGWALVAVGAVLLVTVVGRARRREPPPPVGPDPLDGENLSVRQRLGTIRRAQGAGAIAPDQVRLVRAEAQHTVDHPLLYGWGFVGVGMILAGAAALTSASAVAVLLVVPGVILMLLPLTMGRRLRRARQALEGLPPG